MKVSVTNNRRMAIINVITIILLAILYLSHISHLYLGSILTTILQIANEVAYVALLWYIISILQYWGEKISIQTPFTIFLGLQVVDFLLPLMPSVDPAPLDLSIGVALALITIYMAIAAFRVKNGKIKGAFRVLGIILLLEVALTFGMGMIPYTPGGFRPSNLLGITSLIRLFGILYVVYQNGRNLTVTDTAVQSLP